MNFFKKILIKVSLFVNYTGLLLIRAARHLYVIKKIITYKLPINYISPNLNRFHANNLEFNYENEAQFFLEINPSLRKKYNLKNNPDPKIEAQSEASKIAALITTFNQEPSEISRALNSCINQTCKFDNILVIDGGSTNLATLDYLNLLKQSDSVGVKVEFRPRESIIETRNYAAKISNEDYIVFLDPDDWFNENYVRFAKMILEHFPAIEIIYTDVEVHELNKEIKIWKTGPADFHHLLKHNRLPISSVVRRNFFNAIGGFRSEVDKGPEDWDLWLRAIIYGARAIHIPMALFVNTGVKPNSRTELNSQWKEIQREVVILNALRELNLRNNFEMFPITSKRNH